MTDVPRDIPAQRNDETGTPLRIAFCITELDVGGAERCLTELVTRIDRQRFAPTVYVLAAAPRDENRGLLTRLEAAAVDVRFLGGRTPRDAPHVLKRLAGHLKRQRPALIHSFLFHANLLSRIAARWVGVPKVVCGIRVAERGSRWHIWADRYTSRWVDQYVCVSQSVADFSHRVARLPQEKLMVIGNGVDIARFRHAAAIDPQSLGIPAGRRLLLHVGRLDAQKRVDWLLRLAPRLLDRLPEHNLVLAGRGPQYESLQRLARELKIDHRVHFLGFRTDVPGLLAAADVLLLASAWEGMPNAVLEAMAAGLPVVATRVEGIEELLGPLAPEQSVPPHDAEAFVNHAAAIVIDEQKRRRLGSENQRRAETLFSIDVMVRQHERLYEQCLRAQ